MRELLESTDVVRLSATLEQLTVADEFSGVVRIDQRGRTLLAAAYGPASRTWGVPCRLETRFDTASITKLFTAVATLQQVAAGAFDLQTPVREYLGLADTAVSADVTTYHLLTHTSGIADDADEEAGEDYAALFVVEKAAGRPYRDYVRREVFAPAGMTRSGFFHMDRVEPDVAEGADPITDADGTVTWRRSIYSYPPVGSPDGGAHVTAGDLIGFHRALLAGDLLPSDLTAAMLTPHEDYRRKPEGIHRTGFGFEFLVASDGSVTSYWKEGRNAGASGILRHYPSSDVTAVVLSNQQDGAWEPITQIDALVAG
ncbi:MAG: beta-lactamase family protein [Actinomycetota bacterium]|nr:beta-lactamase family protein [Actinomycetota bacterium]